MKIFWVVQQKYFDNGEVEMKVMQCSADSKPSNNHIYKNTFDEYNDYFNTKTEVKRWLRECGVLVHFVEWVRR